MFSHPRSAVAVTALVVAAACMTNPATGKRNLNFLSESREVALGKESHQQILAEMGTYNDQAWQSYVSRIGLDMAKRSHRPTLPWTFTVVDASAINAFALPGGFIYITRGILPFLRDEAELANVIGHEIAHVTAQHGAQAYSKQLAVGGTLGIASIFASDTQRALLEGAGVGLGLLFLKHGREAELEADQFGVGYAAGGGWNPSGMAGMLGTLGRLSEADGSRRGVPNFLSTHPLPADRVEKVQVVAEAVRTPAATRTNADDFARRLDGVVFGDSREQGIIRGSDFLHPIMRFGLTFPRDWTITNSAQSVVAAPDGESSVGVLLDVVEGTGSPAQVGRASMEQAGLQLRSGDATTINGLEAWVGLFTGGDASAPLTVRAAFVSHAGRMYRIAGVAAQSQFSAMDGTFQSTMRSFRGLSQSQADAIQPARVDFYTARAGDTWASLAQSLGKGAVSANALAIMNGSSPSTAPVVGTRLRVVIGG